MEMLISMNYTQDGGRVITSLYSYPFNKEERQELIQWLGENNDEVYICDFDQNSRDFINGIVTEGCRIV